MIGLGSEHNLRKKAPNKKTHLVISVFLVPVVFLFPVMGILYFSWWEQPPAGRLKQGMDYSVGSGGVTPGRPHTYTKNTHTWTKWYRKCCTYTGLHFQLFLPIFSSKMKNNGQPIRVSVPWNSRCTKGPRWLNNVFLFSTEIWAEQLKPPCICSWYVWRE